MIGIHEISPWVAELLRAAGWRADRHVCHRANPRAVAILESVGGLVVPLPGAGVHPYPRAVQFEPVRAATGEADRAAEWQADLGVALFPLGDVRGGYIVWVGSDEQFYYGHGFGLYKLGLSFGAVLERLAVPGEELERCAD